MNTLQRIFNDNRRTRNPNPDASKIQACIKEGLFVVVSEGPDYCPSTDAIMGSITYFDSAFKTREKAEIQAHTHEAGCDGEISFNVLPALPPVEPKTPMGRPVTTKYEEGDDVPF